MKWFFALNQPSLEPARYSWDPTILAAVERARQHTRLRPHLPYEGDPDEYSSVS